MTNKEAVEKLAYIKTHDTDPEDYEAFNLAIKALEERPQGEWIFKHNSSDVWCSVCGISLASNLCEGIKFGYCPNCGVKMKGEEE